MYKMQICLKVLLVVLLSFYAVKAEGETSEVIHLGLFIISSLLLVNRGVKARSVKKSLINWVLTSVLNHSCVSCRGLKCWNDSGVDE